jgi:hypothetical protein
MRTPAAFARAELIDVGDEVAVIGEIDIMDAWRMQASATA